MRYLKRGSNGAGNLKLQEALRLHEVFGSKADKMVEGQGRLAQKVEHAQVIMELGTDVVGAKLKQMHASMQKMCGVAQEVLAQHERVARAGGGAAAVATQLLREGGAGCDPEKALLCHHDSEEKFESTAAPGRSVKGHRIPP